MMEKSLRRYTSLPILLDILNKQHLTLLDPRNWDDKNDSYFLELYKKHSKFKSVLALCFAEAPECYHHWKIYSGNTSGVCIEFNTDILYTYVNRVTGIRSGTVLYKTIDDFNNDTLNPSTLPFIKRHAFQDEKEFRFIYESESEEIPSKSVKIGISCISRIIFNPWIPKSVFESIRNIIIRVSDCNEDQIVQTTVIENERWKRIAKDKLKNLEMSPFK